MSLDVSLYDEEDRRLYDANITHNLNTMAGQAGIPLINGTHRMGREGGYPDFMGCSAKLYKPAEGGGDEN